MIIKNSKKLDICIYAMTSLLYGFNAVFVAFLIKWLIEIVTQGKMDAMFEIIILGVLGFLFFLVIGILMEYFKNKVIKDINIRLKSKLLSHYYNSYDYENSHNISGFVQSELKLYENKGIYNELKIISLIFIFLISLSASLYLDILTTLSFFIGAFLSSILAMSGQRKIIDSTDEWSKNIDRLTREMEDNNKNRFAYLYNDAFSTIQKKILKKVDLVENSLFKLNYTIDKKNLIIYMVTMLLSIFIPFIVGGFRISNGALSLAGFIAIVQLSNSVINPLLQIIQSLNEYQVIPSIQKKYDDYMNLSIQQHSSKDTFDILEYEDKLLNNDIHISLKKLDRLLIQGPSGIGKSTILNNLICPNSYINYSIDGEEVKKLECFSKLFSYVSQKPLIYNDTILFNLTLGKEVEMKEIESALKVVELEEFVESKGLNYIISENANNISGGEAQRLAIARALLKNNEILLLDEITSSLDNNSADIIRNNIFGLGKTIIEVAHHVNEDYVKKFDKHIILK